MRRTGVSAGGLQTLNGLKSGKDRTEPWVLFACALERTADTDSHRELSRLPPSYDDALARSGRLLFATCLTRPVRARRIANLRQPNDARYCGL